MSPAQLKAVIEGALLAAGRPLGVEDLRGLFAGGGFCPERAQVRELLMPGVQRLPCPGEG